MLVTCDATSTWDVQALERRNGSHWSLTVLTARPILAVGTVKQ